MVLEPYEYVVYQGPGTDINDECSMRVFWRSNAGGWHYNRIDQCGWGLIDAYTTDWNYQQHINYNYNVDASQINPAGPTAIAELWSSVGDEDWRYHNLTQLAGAPAPIGNTALAGYSTLWNQQQHVNFIGNYEASGLAIYELCYSENGGWRCHNLTQLAGALQFNSWFLDGYTTPWNENQHVIGCDYSNGHIYELWYSESTGWRHNDLTQLAGAPSVNGASMLIAYPTPWNQQEHVICQFGAVSPSSQPAFHIQELWYSASGGWRHNDLTDLANAPASGSWALAAYITPWNNQQHVIYVDANGPEGISGSIHELWYSEATGWQHNNLSQLAGVENTYSSCYNFYPPYGFYWPLITGYATPWDHYEHVIWVPFDGNGYGNVHELSYPEGGAWTDTNMTQLADAPALSNVFVPNNNSLNILGDIGYALPS